MSDEKRPVGRPSKFPEINLDKVEILAKKGFTDLEMCEFFGVCRATWNNWKNAHPEFLDSLKDWKSFAVRKVERSLFERATGYEHYEEKVFCQDGQIITHDTVKHYPPDTAAAFIYLKNVDPRNWKDKREVEVKKKKFAIKVVEDDDV